MLGTVRDMVNNSLKFLLATAALRIDRHRIVINKKALEQITMLTSSLLSRHPKRLAELIVQAIDMVGAVTEDMQLLPANEEVASG